MDTSSCIGQKGIIREISDGQAKVNIESSSACSACHSKNACQMGEIEEKTIDVPLFQDSFSIGEEVDILMQKSLGLKAVFLAYILPFSLIIITLITLTGIGFGEVVAGLVSLLVLVPYYFILYLNKKHLQKTFKFILRKSI